MLKFIWQTFMSDSSWLPIFAILPSGLAPLAPGSLKAAGSQRVGRQGSACWSPGPQGGSIPCTSLLLRGAHAAQRNLGDTKCPRASSHVQNIFAAPWVQWLGARKGPHEGPLWWHTQQDLQWSRTCPPPHSLNKQLHCFQNWLQKGQALHHKNF